jgi:2-amino-4-hydroxy-6-hydroxymethyldihydropteridine diphosphokinase
VLKAESVTAYVGLGANLGDAARSVLDAMEALDQQAGIRVTGRSSLYRSAPHEASGPDFINAVVEIATRLSAPDLLGVLQHIERAAGRERPYPNAPRTLDLDLLLYGSARVDSPHLTLPHPRMTQRAFVLVPLAELAPDRVNPGHLQATAGQGVCALSSV